MALLRFCCKIEFSIISRSTFQNGNFEYSYRVNHFTLKTRNIFKKMKMQNVGPVREERATSQEVEKKSIIFGMVPQVYEK